MCTLCACVCLYVCAHLICVRHGNVHGNQNAAPWSRLSSTFAMVDIRLGFYSYLNYLSFKHDEYFMYLEKRKPWNSLKKATESCFQLRLLPGNFWDSGNYRAHKITNDTDQSGHSDKWPLSVWMNTSPFYKAPSLKMDHCSFSFLSKYKSLWNYYKPKHRSPRKWIHKGTIEATDTDIKSLLCIRPQNLVSELILLESANEFREKKISGQCFPGSSCLVTS